MSEMSEASEPVLGDTLGTIPEEGAPPPVWVWDTATAPVIKEDSSLRMSYHIGEAEIEGPDAKMLTVDFHSTGGMLLASGPNGAQVSVDVRDLLGHMARAVVDLVVYRTQGKEPTAGRAEV